MDYIILYNLFFNQIPFNDLEDAEVYLIRKESLYLEKEF